MAKNLTLKFMLLKIFQTQNQAAVEMGLNHCELSRIINGWRLPSKTERKKLIRGLGKKTFERCFPNGNRKREAGWTQVER